MSEITDQQIKTEKKVVRKAEWRYNEDGTYNNKPTSAVYFREYYRENIASRVACDICGRIVGKQKLDKHKTSKICARSAEFKKSSSSFEP